MKYSQAFGNPKHGWLAAALLWALMFLPLAAYAQTTPQSYCANISGCEYLGVKSIIPPVFDSSGTLTYDTYALVEYCRANVFKTSLVYMYNNAYFQLSVAGDVLVLTNTNVCADTTDFP
jgi:hypothetical protein